jgi:hypothetical protein
MLERYESLGHSAVRKLQFDGEINRMWDMGSSDMPSAPTAPSYQSSIQDYINAYPQLAELQKTYAPQIAQMQQQTQQQLYPQQAALGENLASVANQGITSGAPDWYKNQMSDTLSAKFGRNQVFNPLGQQAYGQQYQSGLQNWQNYYNNLGLSLNNKTPLYGASTDITTQSTPSSALSYNSNLYNTAANIYGQQSQNAQYDPWMNVLGSLAGGIGGAATSYGMNKYFPIG